MYKKIDKIIIYLTFILLVVSVYLTFTGSWLARDINLLQMKWIGETKYYPVLTIGILFIPPMLILLPIKLYLKKKLKTEREELNKITSNGKKY
ncbi:MAG: hypothetical protein IPJ32_11905 [Sphingobacteriaceae bacterium]|nr:hypothetical protein [Sphingobacteriaceae bacterium]